MGVTGLPDPVSRARSNPAHIHITAETFIPGGRQDQGQKPGCQCPWGLTRLAEGQVTGTCGQKRLDGDTGPVGAGEPPGPHLDLPVLPSSSLLPGLPVVQAHPEARGHRNTVPTGRRASWGMDGRVTWAPASPQRRCPVPSGVVFPNRMESSYPSSPQVGEGHISDSLFSVRIKNGIRLGRRREFQMSDFLWPATPAADRAAGQQDNGQPVSC